MRGQNYLAGAMGVCALLAAPQEAFAQRTDDNAVTSAEDAFGKSVGDEQIGIYNADYVRGFSPIAAGNVRIEGLYFDQQANLTDRMRDNTTIRVGISSQGYPFPAPTGIADYELRKPAAKRVVSLAAGLGPFGSGFAEADISMPLTRDGLGLVAGYGRYRDEQSWGGRGSYDSFAASLRYAPSPRFMLQPFWSRIEVRREQGQPVIFTSGDFLPPRIPRSRYFGQPWATFDGDIHNYGLVAKGDVAGFALALGVFRSSFRGFDDHIDLLFDTDPDGRSARRVVIAGKDDFFASTSGEFRAQRAFIEGDRRHLFTASLRSRDLTRRYGGNDRIELGASRIDAEDFRVRPPTTIGAKSADAVTQTTFGLAYGLRWRGVGELNAGLQKVDYAKEVTGAPRSTDSPWLYSVAANTTLSPAIAIYGGYTRGLEESDVAPSNAINFNEAPPAIRTTQYDFGARWTISPGLTAVGGWFDVRKPYFNLDSRDRFRQLGTVRNAGVELSLAGQLAKGLTLVAGATYIDATISGEEVSSGEIGRRPVGAFKLRTLANMNWVLPWHEALALTARFESTTERTANRANSLTIPARSVTSLGARYRLSVGKTPILIRGTVDNIFNTFGWNVGGSGFFTPNGPRRVSMSVAADI